MGNSQKAKAPAQDSSCIPKALSVKRERSSPPPRVQHRHHFVLSEARRTFDLRELTLSRGALYALPDPVLRYIGSFLTLQDFLSVSSCSRSFFLITSDADLYWKGLYSLHCNPAQSSTSIAAEVAAAAAAAADASNEGADEKKGLQGGTVALSGACCWKRKFLSYYLSPGQLVGRLESRIEVFRAERDALVRQRAAEVKARKDVFLREKREVSTQTTVVACLLTLAFLGVLYLSGIGPFVIGAVWAITALPHTCFSFMVPRRTPAEDGLMLVDVIRLVGSAVLYLVAWASLLWIMVWALLIMYYVVHTKAEKALGVKEYLLEREQAYQRDVAVIAAAYQGRLDAFEERIQQGQAKIREATRARSGDSSGVSALGGFLAALAGSLFGSSSASGAARRRPVGLAGRYR